MKWDFDKTGIYTGDCEQVDFILQSVIKELEWAKSQNDIRELKKSLWLVKNDLERVGDIVRAASFLGCGDES